MKYALIFFLLMTSSLQTRAEVTSTELFNTINDRLSYMEDVALFKSQKYLSIEDIEREKLVVDRAKISAHNKGLDPSYIEAFFRAQISVAKAIQFRYRADLLSIPSDKKPKDLQKEVRPALLSLGDQIIEQITQYVKVNGSFKPALFAEFDVAINVKYVSTSDKQLLFKALQEVKQLPAN